MSEQQVVSCDTSKDKGCDGGLSSNAYKYLEKNAVELDSDYPYTSGTTHNTGDCQVESSKEMYFVSSSKNVAKDNAKQLKAAIAQQPVSVSICAGAYDIQFYKFGIISKDKCCFGLDHAVVAVGYGTDKTPTGDIPYYIVRNSWGEDWGEDGYFRLEIDDSFRAKGTCGIQERPLYPVAKN